MSDYDQRREELGRLARKVAHCPHCEELVEDRTAPVFGKGTPRASALLVGEAPGKMEDRHGEPFVGQAGQLLDELLKQAGIAKQRVYMTNIIKCRPPGNRNPRSEEISHCRPYLLEQLRLIRPRVIAAPGRVATAELLGRKITLQDARGKVHRFGEIPLVCSYHPAFVRRTPSVREHAVDDLKLVLDQLDKA